MYSFFIQILELKIENLQKNIQKSDFRTKN